MLLGCRLWCCHRAFYADHASAGETQHVTGVSSISWKPDTVCGLTSTQESTAPMGALCSVSSLGALVVILKLMIPVCMHLSPQ